MSKQNWKGLKNIYLKRGVGIENSKQEIQQTMQQNK